jgi:hypothetical protein
MSAPRLPAGFAALEPFVDDWAISGAANRMAKRLSSSDEDRTAFFDAAKELVAPALAELDRTPLGQFDDKEKRLMDLMLCFAHVAMAVEIQGDDEPKHARDAQHMKIITAPSDVDERVN